MLIHHVQSLLIDFSLMNLSNPLLSWVKESASMTSCGNKMYKLNYQLCEKNLLLLVLTLLLNNFMLSFSFSIVRDKVSFGCLSP